MHLRAYFAAALLGCTLTAHAVEPTTPQESAQELVSEVIHNELQDRECDSFWRYRSVRHAGQEDIIREQVETAEGPIYRVLEDHGARLDAAARVREDRRLDSLVQNRTGMERIEQEHIESEGRLKTVMELLPKAFLFHYESLPNAEIIRIAFVPDPSFKPNGYEARIIHAMGGTLLIDRSQKRMVEMKGTLLDSVTFGYGVLGYVEKGGSYEIRRVPVDSMHWKTSLVDVHVAGRVLLFENVEKDQHESRSDFYPVPHSISIRQAENLLNQAAEEDHTSLRAQMTACR